MKGYRFVTYNPVYHNGAFARNIGREEIVHAKSEVDARKKIHLEKPEKYTIGYTTVKTGGEYIHHCEYLGVVVEKVTYEYVK